MSDLFDLIWLSFPLEQWYLEGHHNSMPSSCYIKESWSDTWNTRHTKFPISFVVRLVMRPISLQWKGDKSDKCYPESRAHQIGCVSILRVSFIRNEKGNHMRTMPCERQNDYLIPPQINVALNDRVEQILPRQNAHFGTICIERNQHLYTLSHSVLESLCYSSLALP